MSLLIVEKDQLLFLVCQFIDKSDIQSLLTVSKTWQTSLFNLQYLWQTFSIRHDILSPDFNTNCHHTNISFLNILPKLTKDFIVSLRLDLYLLNSLNSHTYKLNHSLAFNCIHTLSSIGHLPNLKALSIFSTNWLGAQNNNDIINHYQNLCNNQIQPIIQLENKPLNSFYNIQSVYNTIYENNSYSEYDDFNGGILQKEFDLFLKLNPQIEHLEGIFAIFKANEQYLTNIKSIVVCCNISAFNSQFVANKVSFISSTFQMSFMHPEYFYNLKYIDMCVDTKFGRRNILIDLLQQFIECKIFIKAISIFDCNNKLNNKIIIDKFMVYLSNNCAMEWINIQNSESVISKDWKNQMLNFPNVKLTYNERKEWLNKYCSYGIQHDVVANFVNLKYLQEQLELSES